MTVGECEWLALTDGDVLRVLDGELECVMDAVPVGEADNVAVGEGETLRDCDLLGDNEALGLRVIECDTDVDRGVREIVGRAPWAGTTNHDVRDPIQRTILKRTN